MSLELVENRGPNTMLNRLSKSISKARAIDIAVAFITEGGIKQIHTDLLDVAAKGCRIRILTSLPRNAFNRIRSSRIG